MRVLLIGATSAIAQSIADECAARGDRLFLLARDANKLAALVDAVDARNAHALAGFEAGDFTDTAASEARIDRAAAALGGIDLAIIAHGDLGSQLESERSIAHAEAIFAVNFTSVVSFVIPLANRFEAEGRGTLVVLSSVAGDRGRPRNYTYGAAKGALSIYLQGARSRLFGQKNIRICTIRLGPVDTPMTVDHPKNALFGKPGAVARTILAAAESGPEDVYVPWFWLPIMATVRTLPERIFQRFSFLAGR
jgi:short-subunit dehydrogenase